MLKYKFGWIKNNKFFIFRILLAIENSFSRWEIQYILMHILYIEIDTCYLSIPIWDGLLQQQGIQPQHTIQNMKIEEY